jgi:hypothetical protein
MSITKRIEKISPIRRYVATLRAGAVPYITTEKLREEGRLDSDSSSLNYIICHPWHSRIWTVQEAAYSRHCQVVCGNSTSPWDAYCAAIHFLLFEELIDQLDPQAHKNYVCIDVRNTIRDYLRKRQSPKLTLSTVEEEGERNQRVILLSSCLSDVNQLEATEPRDKIYGMHALYTDLGIPLPEVSYEKSLSGVYEGAAIAMITWSCTLKVLGDACHNDRSATFPSWVPDWSDGNIKIFTPSGNATVGSGIAKPSSVALNPRPGELHVQGKVIGSIIAWRNNEFPTTAFPTRPEQCEPSILTGRSDDFVEDPEILRLCIYAKMTQKTVSLIF